MNWLFWLWLAGFSGPQTGTGELLFIVAQGSPLNQISRTEMRQIYLCKRDRLSGTRVTPLHLPEDHQLRQQFDTLIFDPGFDQSDYWVRQRFGGGEKPPRTVANQAHVLVYVARNPGFIGYVDARYRAQLERFDLKPLRVVE